MKALVATGSVGLQLQVLLLGWQSKAADDEAPAEPSDVEVLKVPHWIPQGMDLTVCELELLFITELMKLLQCLRCLEQNSGKKCRLTKGSNCTLCKKHKVKCSLMLVKADGQPAQPDHSKRSNNAWLNVMAPRGCTGSKCQGDVRVSINSVV